MKRLKPVAFFIIVLAMLVTALAGAANYDRKAYAGKTCFADVPAGK